jgi:polyphosphate kinase 2 (PPK2 family)
VLSAFDLDQSLGKDEYKEELRRLQLEARRLALRMYEAKRSLIVVYEGWDAAGKGGNIRRLVATLDPRGYHIYSIGPPEGDEQKHHYLWRFWHRLIPPDEKQITIFDRSWYGRVLVERVEGFATAGEWKRAYREINEFERQLTGAGIALAKFWLHISRDEQLRRFEARESTPHKRFKLTDEDWRNREKWDAYEAAVNDMLLKTSPPSAPWTVIEGNCKRFARVKTLATFVDAMNESTGHDSASAPDREGAR